MLRAPRMSIDDFLPKDGKESKNALQSAVHLMSLSLSNTRSLIQSKYSYIAILLVSFSLPLIYSTVESYARTNSVWQRAVNTAQPVTQTANIMSDSITSRTPVYFLGIGGPNFMEAKDHPAYHQLAAVGREITTKIRPKAVVVFSAHWQAHPDKISVNIAEHTDLIYDFYNFPAHYYEYDYPNRGSREVAEKVIDRLTAAGIEVERVKRGLDHGVWVGFRAGRSTASLCLTYSSLTRC